MKLQDAKDLIEQGYELRVYLVPDKKYENMRLTTRIRKEGTFKEVYYNHVKQLLSDEQIDFIELYKKAKDMEFRDLFDLNMKSNNNTLSAQEERLLVMYQSIKKMETVYI